MTRLATYDDVLDIYEKSVVFNTAYYDIPLDTSRCMNWIVSLIEDGVAIVSKTGYIGGLIVSDPVRNWTALVEVAWFDTGLSGAHLLRHFIAEGKRLGVDEVRMTTLSKSPVAAATVLRRLGFSPLETSHRLIIKEP